MTRSALLAALVFSAAAARANDLKCAKLSLPKGNEELEQLQSCKEVVGAEPQQREELWRRSYPCQQALCSAAHYGNFEKKVLPLQNAFDGKSAPEGKKKDLLALKKEYAALYPKLTAEPKDWTRDQYAKTAAYYMAACDKTGKPEREPWSEGTKGPTWLRSVDCRFGLLNEFSADLDKEMKEHIASYASERRAALQ